MCACGLGLVGYSYFVVGRCGFAGCLGCVDVGRFVGYGYDSVVVVVVALVVVALVVAVVAVAGGAPVAAVVAALVVVAPVLGVVGYFGCCWLFVQGEVAEGAVSLDELV